MIECLPIMNNTLDFLLSDSKLYRKYQLSTLEIGAVVDQSAERLCHHFLSVVGQNPWSLLPLGSLVLVVFLLLLLLLFSWLFFLCFLICLLF